jgi:hypothetical protein
LLATPDGTVYISTYNDVVGTISSTSSFTAFAGKPTSGQAGDGQNASQALFYQPTGLAADDAGNLFIADVNRVRKVSKDGTIQTYAGNGGLGSSGDGGPPIDAQFSFLAELALDRHGNLYISDYGAVLQKLGERV